MKSGRAATETMGHFKLNAFCLGLVLISVRELLATSAVDLTSYPAVQQEDMKSTSTTSCTGDSTTLGSAPNNQAKE